MRHETLYGRSASSARRDINPIAEHEYDLDWAKTRRYMRADFERFLASIEDRGSMAKRLYWWLMPHQQALVWYRVSRCLYLKGWPLLARLVHLFSIYQTRAEIPPTASIGPGCLIGHATGARLCGRIGRNFTLWGDGGTGGGIIEGDVGGSPGLPCVGDNVTLGLKSMILGAVRVGDGAKLGPGVIATRDIPAYATLFNAPPRMLLDPDAEDRRGRAAEPSTGASH